MKKNVASLLLALVLCLSLLPTEALADDEGGAYQTGLYTAVNEEGVPGGSYTGGSRPAEDGPWGYWDIPYTSGSTAVLYYYDAETSAFTCSVDGISISYVGDHLWKIEISMSAGHGDFTAGFDLADGGFPISFKDQYTPAPGLYYKELVDGPGDPPHEVGNYVPLESIDCAPFVDRLAFALYSYNGTSYTPVERVRLPQGSAFDLMWVRDWWGDMWEREWGPEAPEPQGNWYYLSAFDFSRGTLEWFADPNANEPAGSIPLNSHYLPDVAFYSEATDPSEDSYRMYALMGANTNVEYADYQFSSTLYVLARDSDLTFSDANDVACFQKEYDDRGYQTGEHQLRENEDYAYTCVRSTDEKMLTFTIYANDSDLLVWLEHGPGDYYGAYVNFLADTGSGLYFNLGDAQGFETAKYLPSHLFRQVLAADGTITLQQAGCQAAVTCDQDMVSDIAGQLAERQVAVCFSTADLTEEQAEALDTAAGEGSSVVDILDLNLAYGAVAQHELAGTVSVSYPYALPSGTQVKVYYLDGENAVRSMDAVYRNGQIIFSTDHFSNFAIVTVPAPSPAPSHDDRDDTEPSYQVKIDAEGISADRRTAKAGELVTLTVKEGCNISGILVSDRNGSPVEVTYQDGKYTFRMPRGKITVTPIYAPAEPTFADVDGKYWASDAIRWAAEKGYMTGVSDTVFAPEGKVSRQQVWMILARLSGAEPAGMAEAKAWAIANGVSDGTAPGAAVTRQQLVTLLYRYAVLMGYDVSAGKDTNILSYGDALSVSEYAVPAFQWACGAGIIGGTTSGTLAPQGNATRAQFAVILFRFCGEFL